MRAATRLFDADADPNDQYPAELERRRDFIAEPIAVAVGYAAAHRDPIAVDRARESYRAGASAVLRGR